MIDPETAADIELWKVDVDLLGAKIVGSVKSSFNAFCYAGECGMGSFIADSYVNSQIKDAEDGSWTFAAISLMNPGGVRGSVSSGVLTFADLVMITPFENTLDSCKL